MSNKNHRVMTPDHENKDKNKKPFEDRVNHEMRDYSNEPFFLQKDEAAKKRLETVEFPKEFLKKK